jgi:uncharacterized SAM-binding protein YcdF (DUF218 family)
VTSLFKELLLPGSLPFFILALIPGVLLLYWRRGRIGRIWVTVLVLFYWLASTPIVAAWLVEATSPELARIDHPEQLGGATAIVLLGAGGYHYESRGEMVSVVTPQAGLRVVEAARIARLLEDPLIIITGGATFRGRSEAEILRLSLVDLGIPRDAVVLEHKSLTTYDHPRNVAPMLAARGIKRFVLVTSLTHMRRALLVFRAAGYDPVPAAPEPFSDFRRWTPTERCFPSERALAVSTAVFYDAFGLGYYWIRGWL